METPSAIYPHVGSHWGMCCSQNKGLFLNGGGVYFPHRKETGSSRNYNGHFQKDPELLCRKKIPLFTITAHPSSPTPPQGYNQSKADVSFVRHWQNGWPSSDVTRLRIIKATRGGGRGQNFSQAGMSHGTVGSVRNSNLKLVGKAELRIFYIMRGTANGVRKRTQKRGRALQLNKSTPAATPPVRIAGPE